MIKACPNCGGLFATEPNEMWGGRSCECGYAQTLKLSEAGLQAEHSKLKDDYSALFFESDSLRQQLAFANDAAAKGEAGRKMGIAYEECQKENIELRQQLLAEKQRAEEVVKVLADTAKWSWMDSTTGRHAADSALMLMSRAGLIEHCRHPSGGDVWKSNGKLFGRTDDMTLEKFDNLKERKL